MQLGFPLFVLTAILFSAELARGQDVPPNDVLNAIIPQLRKKLPGTEISFRTDLSEKEENSCGMQGMNMTIARGTDNRTFHVLVDPQFDSLAQPKQVLARITRLTVDADGGTRAYHPDDPYGEGNCNKIHTPNGSAALQGICALDEISNAGIRLFLGSKMVTRSDPAKGPERVDFDLAKEWISIWPLIRTRRLKSIDLKAIAGPGVPDGYRLFYWNERNMTVFFNENNIPLTWDGYPCLRGSESHYPGYFIAGTTLRQRGAAREDGCAPSHYIDAEQIPYFVLPGRSFGQIGIGDIVVGYMKSGSQERLVYGVAADTGPFDQFGEGSIAFNQALLGNSDVVMNRKSTEALDIDVDKIDKKEGKQGILAILVLGGTKNLLNGNFSRENIEEIGHQELARWNGTGVSPTQRLNACVGNAKINNIP